MKFHFYHIMFNVNCYVVLNDENLVDQLTRKVSLPCLYFNMCTCALKICFMTGSQLAVCIFLNCDLVQEHSLFFGDVCRGRLKEKKKEKTREKIACQRVARNSGTEEAPTFGALPPRVPCGLQAIIFFSRGFFLDSRDSLHRKGSAQSLPLIGCPVFFGIGFSSLN